MSADDLFAEILRSCKEPITAGEPTAWTCGYDPGHTDTGLVIFDDMSAPPARWWQWRRKRRERAFRQFVWEWCDNPPKSFSGNVTPEP